MRPSLLLALLVFLAPVVIADASSPNAELTLNGHGPTYSWPQFPFTDAICAMVWATGSAPLIFQGTVFVLKDAQAATLATTSVGSGVTIQPGQAFGACWGGATDARTRTMLPGTYTIDASFYDTSLGATTLTTSLELSATKPPEGLGI